MVDARLTPANRAQAHAHYNMAYLGGFFGVAPILSVAHAFGSAQTLNLIEMVDSLLIGDHRRALLRLCGYLVFIAAVFLTTTIPKHTRLRCPYLALLVDLAAALVLAFLPEDTEPIAALYPVMFATAFQWTSFQGGYGYNSATIFSTNNSRQCFSAIAEVVFNRDPSFKLKAAFYGLTLIWYHIGVACSVGCWLLLGQRGVLLVAPALLVGLYHVRRMERTRAAEQN